MKKRLRKEFRSILPAWLVTIFLPFVPYIFSTSNEAAAYSFLLFWVACALLGAAAFGTEFDHRTMVLLLSQPVSRRRLWFEKLTLLGAALLVSLLVFLVLTLAFAHHELLLPMLLPILCAFAAGPFMTLTARNIIGGTVFSLTVPCLIYFMAASLSLRFEESFHSSHTFFFFTASFPIYWIAGYALGYRKFKRLEIAESQTNDASGASGLTVPFAWAINRLSSKFSGPWASLIRKEILLQQTSFIVAAVFCIIWFAAIAARPLRWDLWNEMLPTVLLAIYVVMVTITIGALSIAEERHLGLLEWHLTLRPSMVRQWLNKLAITFLVTLFLAVILPLALLGRGEEWRIFEQDLRSAPPLLVLDIAVVLCLITAISIYASSVSRNTLGAAILALGACTAVAALLVSLFALTQNYLAEILSLRMEDIRSHVNLHDALISNVYTGFAVACLLLLTWILRFAFVNFRSSDVQPRRLCAQALQVFALILIILLALVTGEIRLGV